MPFLFDRHVFCCWFITASNRFWVVKVLILTCPSELYPNPALVVIVDLLFFLSYSNNKFLVLTVSYILQEPQFINLFLPIPFNLTLSWLIKVFLSLWDLTIFVILFLGVEVIIAFHSLLFRWIHRFSIFLIKIVLLKNSFILLFNDSDEILSHSLSFWWNFHIKIFKLLKDFGLRKFREFFARA